MDSLPLGVQDIVASTRRSFFLIGMFAVRSTNIAITMIFGRSVLENDAVLFLALSTVYI